MLIGLVLKILATALVVIAVTVIVGRLGPRLGGIFAGTPIILGPGFFFLLREQPPAFVASAAVSSLHALTATLVFTVIYVLCARRFGAWASVALATFAWLPAAWFFAALPDLCQGLAGGPSGNLAGDPFIALAGDLAGNNQVPAPEVGIGAGLGLGLLAYVLVYLAARWINRRLDLPPPRGAASAGWPDLLIRGGLAGLLVGLATSVAALSGPVLSGLLVGFPVGLISIGLTLQQRYGVAVLQATLMAVQPALFSLVAFTVTVGLTAERMAPMPSFGIALVASIGVSLGLLVLSRSGPRQSLFRRVT